MKNFVVVVSLNDGEEFVRDVRAESAAAAVAAVESDCIGMQVADVFVDMEQC